jgi:hypothetical protein
MVQARSTRVVRYCMSKRLRVPTNQRHALAPNVVTWVQPQNIPTTNNLYELNARVILDANQGSRCAGLRERASIERAASVAGIDSSQLAGLRQA